MKSWLTILLLSATIATGFTPLNRNARRAWVPVVRNALSNPQPFDSHPVDLERAQDCANHFGKCSVDEMEHLKEGLHKERVQETLFGSSDPSTQVDAFEHRVLEEELSLQLDLLKEQEVPSQLFPAEKEEEATMNPDQAQQDADQLRMEKLVESEILLMEEEGLFDAAAICAVIAVAFVAPQVLFGN